jgi:N utilization substance protein B
MPDHPEPRRQDAGSPRRARLHALKVLFQADLRGETPGAALARVAGDPHALALLDDLDDTAPAGEATPRIDAFTRRLVEGVDEHRDEIDARIQRFARRWAISRMPVVDRNVLRLATYELLYEDTPAAIVIDEALELAKALSTDNSSRYVNGVLDSVRKSIAAERGGAA